MSYLAEDTRINALEDLVIKLRLYPNDVSVVEEIIKTKNVDIQALRKQLKLPTKEHPQIQEGGKLEKEK